MFQSEVNFRVLFKAIYALIELIKKSICPQPLKIKASRYYPLGEYKFPFTLSLQVQL